MLEFDGEFTADHPKLLAYMLENHEKSAVKYSIEKHALLNFVNLSAMFCTRLSQETHFQF